MAVDLAKKSIVIFGFGVQGRAQALNLRDSGLKIKICLPAASSSIREVKSSGLELITDPVAAASLADIAVMLVPDSVQKGLYGEISGALPQNGALLFAHGLNIHYGFIRPRRDLDVILVSPMAHGSEVRKACLDKCGLAVLIAVSQNITGSAWQIAGEYAKALGASSKGTIKATFAEETETDLFTEQTLICGGIWGLVTAAFETLVEAGYSPEIAYHCCLKETKIMSEIFAQHGMFETFRKISDVARFGALSRGPRIIDKEVKRRMKAVLADIKNGGFIRDFQEEIGKKKEATTKKLMKSIRRHELEALHRRFTGVVKSCHEKHV